ncbi:hypothetical protein N7540_011024 [Penicillium herquei]|nr:hypothetical protein N7540_011024 [Penicillium herquei]
MSVPYGTEELDAQSWCSDYDEVESLAAQSTTQATDELSDTSEDLSFVISDGQSFSSASSASDLPGLSRLPNAEPYGPYPNEVGHISPVGVIARRQVIESGQVSEEYLVLWCSWESRVPFG